MIRAVGGDLAAFFAAFEEGHESADIDQNGGVEGGDLALFLQWSEAGFAGDHTLDAQRFLYRGYHWDDALKMYHVRHRVYDPARMLWIQRDPLGRIPGANEYAYCLGEPIDFYDPMGLEGDGLDDIRDQLKRVPGDPDTNMGATPEQMQMQRDDASRANRIFDALGDALISLTPVVGDIAEVREINADPNRSTLNKIGNSAGVIVTGFLAPVRAAKALHKAGKAADKIDDAADAVKAADNAKVAAKGGEKVTDVGGCAKGDKTFTADNFRENVGKDRSRPLVDGEHAHHIVPQRDKRAKKAQDMLKKLGVDIHDPANGAILTVEQHKRIHSKDNAQAYYDAVYDVLSKSKTSDEAKAALREIRDSLERGELP